MLSWRSAIPISTSSPNSRDNRSRKKVCRRLPEKHNGMIAVKYSPYTLRFKERAVTSRDSLTSKEIYVLEIESPELPGGKATGEVAMFRGLSAEDTPDFPRQLDLACRKASEASFIEEMMAGLPEISSIRFGFESALIRARRLDLFDEAKAWLREGVTINGLVWMGDKATMRRRIAQKIEQGFHCVKLKIGGIDFNDEEELLREIRKEFSPADIELRLDANGSFTPGNAMERLERLARYEIHSIEQPVKPGQWDVMARLCSESPIPIALDEELIGFRDREFKVRMLSALKPRYIILKPTLCGGFRQAEEWIDVARQLGIGWWSTSALESNIGLEALTLWTASLRPTMPQGLGTGELYLNNFPSALCRCGEKLKLAVD